MLDRQTEVFAYLETLRESGRTNMYGAGQFLEDEFGFTVRQAREYLTAWMASYETA